MRRQSFKEEEQREGGDLGEIREVIGERAGEDIFYPVMLAATKDNGP